MASRRTTRKPGRPAAKPRRQPAKKVARPAVKAAVGKAAAGKAAAGRPRGSRPARRPPTRRRHSGGCHCGAILYTFDTALLARRWRLLACQCSFCRGHGARLMADPAGEIQFDFTLPEFLRRYRFGLRTAEYLICRECGTFVAAVIITGRGALGAINVNSLREPPAGLGPGRPVVQDLESAEARRSRRARTWTPVTGPV